MDKTAEQIEKLLNRKKLFDNVVNLCSKSTINPPGNEYVLNETIKSIYQEIGCQDIDLYEKVKGRSNLIGRLKGKRPGKVYAVVGHTDVVPVDGQDWETDPFEPIMKDGMLYARGAIDNKGPFAATLEGIRIFHELTKGDFAGEILIIAAADEEVGSALGISYLFEEVGLVCDYALIPDGGEFQHSIYGEMGILQLEFNATGKAFHGSQPELGVNAIAPIAQLYLELYKKDWSELVGHEEFDHTVLNLGLIKGGVAANIVPEKALFNAMWRYPVEAFTSSATIDAQIIDFVNEKVEAVQKNYPDVKLEYKQIHKSKPFLGNKNSEFFRQSVESAQILGLEAPILKTMRAETVGKYINQACGAEIIVNGPMDGSIGLMHQPNEHVEIKSLENFARYYALLLYRLLA